jgi:hypothetical protein
MKRPRPQLEQITNPSPWERQLLLSSIPLKCLSSDGEIVGRASGCLIDYHGHRLILSAAHATVNPGIWCIELEFEPGKGQAYYPLDSLNFLGKISTQDLVGALKSGRLQELSRELVDFCYQLVPKGIESYYEEFDTGGQVLRRFARTVFESQLDELPGKGVKYGFSGISRVEDLPDPRSPTGRVLVPTQVVCGVLSHLESNQDRYYFALPGEHPGHDEFRGCSGAPIVSEKGELVALLVGSRPDDEAICGLPLRTFKTAIDIEVGRVPPDRRKTL